MVSLAAQLEAFRFRSQSSLIPMAHSHGTPVAQANFMLVGALVMGMVLAVFLGRSSETAK
jgi:hypothetical protein